MKLFIALRAFMAIMRERPHIFCDDTHHTAIGTGDQIADFVEIITEAVAEDLEQQVALLTAKKILNN